VDFVVNRNHSESDGSLNGTTIGDTSSNDYGTVYGLQVTVPIFSGGLTSSRVRQAQYRHTAARERLERTGARHGALDARCLPRRQLRDGARAVAEAGGGIGADALSATEAGYEVGTRTSIDVLQARQRLFQSQTDYARSRYDYLLNVLRLQQAAGTLDAKGLDDINALLTENVGVR
jgi:outer membrane protein